MGKTKKNIIYQMAYQILAIALPLITTPLVTRGLGADGLGQYSYSSSIVSYFSIFALLGVNNYGTREISKANAGKDKLKVSRTFCGIYYLQLILSVVVIIAYYITVAFALEQYKVLLLIQGLNLLGTLFDVSWLYFGLENFKATVTRNIIVKLLCAAVIIFFVKEPNDIYLYTLTLIFSTMVSNFVMLIGAKKYIDFIFVPIKDIITHFKPNVILFIPVVAASVFNYTDKIMLGRIVGTVQTGYYEAMEKIINVPMAGVSAIANVMFPRISALVKQGGEKNKTEIEKYVERSLYGVVWFAVACFFGMLAVAPKFVPFFLGDDFEGAIGVVQLGCLILLPKSFRIILNSECLLPYEKDKGTIVSTILAAISNILLNFIMIPQLGAVGAEIATIISEIIYCIVMLAIIGNQFGTFKIIITSIPFTLFGYCMYQSIAFIGNKVNFNILLSLCVQIFFGGIFYLGLSAIYLTVCLRTFKKRGL
jgi:O-antigen/teichoic acid export membrane protein